MHNNVFCYQDQDKKSGSHQRKPEESSSSRRSSSKPSRAEEAKTGHSSSKTASKTSSQSKDKDRRSEKTSSKSKERPSKVCSNVYHLSVCLFVCLSVYLHHDIFPINSAFYVRVNRVMDKIASQVLPSKRSGCQKILQSKILLNFAYHLP